MKNKKTTVLILPALDDVISYYPLPQPPYDLNFINTSHLEMIRDGRMKFISNPSVIQVNEIIIGVSNFEYFEEVKQQSNFEKKGINPILNSILKIRSFYPLIPFKSEDGTLKSTIIDYTQLEKLQFLDVIPDIFIYPNKNLAYAKSHHKSLFIHPGCVCPNLGNKGNFVRIYAYPNTKLTGLDVINRVKVEKIVIEQQ